MTRFFEKPRFQCPCCGNLTVTIQAYRKHWMVALWNDEQRPKSPIKHIMYLFHAGLLDEPMDYSDRCHEHPAPNVV